MNYNSSQIKTVFTNRILIQSLSVITMVIMFGLMNTVNAETYEALKADTKYVYCSGKQAKVGSQKDGWKLDGRSLVNKNGKKLDCAEKLREGDDCSCTSSGERFHGGPNTKGGTIKDSIGNGKSGQIFPNSGKQYCLRINGDILEVTSSINGSWANCATFKFDKKTFKQCKNACFIEEDCDSQSDIRQCKKECRRECR